MIRAMLKGLRDLDPGLLCPIERLLRKKVNAEATLVVLLAPPRSGSTLCYQLLCHSCDLDYVSNFHYLGHRYPFLFQHLGRRLLAPYVSDFKSDHGVVCGLNGPAEANDFWGVWCDQRLKEQEPNPSQKRLEHLRSYFGWLANEAERPFLAGWIGHVLYPDEILRVFPSALFLRLRRRKEDIASSLLKARRKLNGNQDEWLSTWPNECHNVEGMTAHEQVAKQVSVIERRLDHFSEAQRSSVLDVSYADLCEDPGGFVRDVQSFLALKNVRLRPRVDLDQLKSFRKSSRSNRQNDSALRDTYLIDEAFARLS